MYGRNLALLYQAPSYTSDKATEELSNEELKQLIQDVESMLDDSVRDAFSTNILRHVGDQANYELKAQALQSLKLVADKLHDTDTEDSEKTIIALKLQERAENCTPGFHNGINEIVEGFYMADNLQDLLFRVRQDIVSRLATTLTEDTHANNHIFAMAENLKYGVRAINRQDIYINTNRLDEHIIEEKLKEAFKKNLGLFGMLQGVEDQLKGQLMSLGYEGVQSEGYKHGTTDKLFDYFMRLFKDTDTVNNYTIAKTDLESTRKKAEEARTEAELSIEALLEKHKIPLESHKSAKIKALLGDKSVLNLPFIKTFLETLPLNLLNSDDLKKIRNTLTERSEVTDANTEYSERNQALHQKFFIGENGIVTDINWPEIKQLIWHQVRDQQYFKFRKANEELTGAEKLMEAITDPNTQSLDDLKDYFRDLINNIDDFIFVKQYLPPEQQRVLHESFDDTVPNIIQNAEDLGMIFKYSDLENQKRLFTATQKLHETLIQDPDSLLSFVQHLEPEICSQLFTDISVKLSTLINNKHDFLHVFDKISPEAQPQFIDFMKNKIPDIIQSLDDVKDVLKHQKQQGQDLFLAAIKEHIPNIIKNTEDVRQAFDYYSPEFQIDFLQTKKQKLLEMI
ncbi:MAG: hypothetical protein P1U36_00825, partial [Legionellaceae bacterium]|nr:hypothetical protein [Legionellaceae bacterium]